MDWNEGDVLALPNIWSFWTTPHNWKSFYVGGAAASELTVSDATVWHYHIQPSSIKNNRKYVISDKNE